METSPLFVFVNHFKSLIISSTIPVDLMFFFLFSRINRMYSAAVPCERTTHQPILLTGKIRMPFLRSFKIVFQLLIISCFSRKADSCFPVQPSLLSIFCKLFLIPLSSSKKFRKMGYPQDTPKTAYLLLTTYSY